MISRLKARRWEDLVFFFGALIFDLVQLGMIVDPTTKVALSMSILNCIILLVFAFTQYKMGLKLASTLYFVNTIEWIILAIYRH